MGREVVVEYTLILKTLQVYGGVFGGFLESLKYTFATRPGNGRSLLNVREWQTGGRRDIWMLGG